MLSQTENQAIISSNRRHDAECRQQIVLELSSQEPISQGKRQLVYEHPNDPTSLIKLQKPDKLKGYDSQSSRRVFDSTRLGEGYKDFLREFREYIELRTRCPKDTGDFPICAVRGIVETDLGLGLIYERIANTDGSLAPTLRSLVEEGKVTQQHLDDLDEHFRILSEFRVVLSNFNLLNLVYQTRADGSGRFVWIDSMGCKQTVPTRRWFKTLNDRKLDKIKQHFRQKMLDSMPAHTASTAVANEA